MRDHFGDLLECGENSPRLVVQRLEMAGGILATPISSTGKKGSTVRLEIE